MAEWLELGLEENGFYGYFKEGTRHPDISCVLAASPYDYVLECVDDRFKRTGKSTYSWQGRIMAEC